MNPETALSAPESDPSSLVTGHSPHTIAEIVPIATGRYAIPAEDTAKGGRWDRLTQDERTRINRLLDCFRQMESGKIVEEAKVLAFRLRNVKGFSASNLKTLYYAWRENGWQALCKSYAAANKSALPREFLEYWRALCEQNGRSIVFAKVELFRRWFCGEAIPGYGTWIEWWHATNPLKDCPKLCPGTPAGWSKTTLYEAGPTAQERMWATRGFAAVKPLLPTLVRDTSTLLPLQLLTMDDFETDQVAFAQDPRTKKWQLTKVTGVAVMDVATRRVIAVLMKPRFTDDEGKRESITRAEVRLLFFQVLRDYGVPHCGQTWLVENAAAAITAELEMTVRNLFGGRIQITRTGLIHDKVFGNGFIERGGKPQQKGWIEARFNLMHNAAGALEGQKGANYLVKPGDHEAKVQYAEHLLGDGERDARPTDEQIRRLRLPFKSADELIAFYMSELFPALDRRVEHKMGGFELLRRWRRDEHDTWHEWEELSALSEAEQTSPTLQWYPRELRESSRMRWDRLIKNVRCEKIAERVLMMLLLTPRSAKMRKTGVTFTHAGQGYSFADKRALALRLPEGMEVLCYFDPARPHSVHICSLEGRHLAELRSLSVNIADAAAMSEAEQHLSELYNTILGTVRSRPLHLEADRQLGEDREHNARIEAEEQPEGLKAGKAEGLKPETRIQKTETAAVSPVRKYREKMGVTAALTRDCFAKPGEAAHTATGEAMAATVIASDAARAADERTARTIAASDDLDPSAL